MCSTEPVPSCLCTCANHIPMSIWSCTCADLIMNSCRLLHHNCSIGNLPSCSVKTRLGQDSTTTTRPQDLTNNSVKQLLTNNVNQPTSTKKMVNLNQPRYSKRIRDLTRLNSVNLKTLRQKALWLQSTTQSPKQVLTLDNSQYSQSNST